MKSTKFHNEQYFAYAFMIQVIEPTTVQEALSNDDYLRWQEAMNKEY